MLSHELKEWYVILNPVAGGGKARREWKNMESLFQANGFEFELGETNDKGHAIVLAKEAIKKGYRNIIAIGGDGTNNEVVNGIFKQKDVPTKEISYALIPIGTGNDWRRTYNISKNYRKWIPLIKNKKTKFQDIGLASYYSEGEKLERYFVNVAGMAYDAFIGKKSAERKGGVSKLVYLSLVLKYLFSYENKKAAVIFGDQDFEAKFYSINIGICKYSGGGMQLVPHAIPDDGLLALTYDGGLSKLEILKITPSLFSGNIGKHKKVFTHQVKQLRVEAREDRPTYLEVDGEFLGETPCEFTILEKSLNVIVP